MRCVRGSLGRSLNLQVTSRWAVHVRTRLQPAGPPSPDGPGGCRPRKDRPPSGPSAKVLPSCLRTHRRKGRCYFQKRQVQRLWAALRAGPRAGGGRCGPEPALWEPPTVPVQDAASWSQGHLQTFPPNTSQPRQRDPSRSRHQERGVLPPPPPPRLTLRRAPRTLGRRGRHPRRE